MYDLSQMTLRDMSECGKALRHSGDNVTCMEEASNKIIQYIYENFIDKHSSTKACALVRLFKTHSYGKLTVDLQKYVQNCFRKELGQKQIPDDLKCLTLLGTAGELPEWNSRDRSNGHQAIPLVNEAAISAIPMISQLIQQLGLDIGVLLTPQVSLITDLEQKMYNVFYVPHALNSPYIPAQDSFVKPFNIKSVIGFGGLLPSGNMFVLLMFSKVMIPETRVDLFRPLALNVKMALLPFDEGRVFTSLSENKVGEVNQIPGNIIDSEYHSIQTHQALISQISTLNQLLEVSEGSTISQSDRLENTVKHLHNTVSELQETQVQLLHTEKMSSLGEMIAGIVHEINNPFNFVSGNLDYVKQYTQNLLKLIQAYQVHYPQPVTEIQDLIDDMEFDFIKDDFIKIIDSMKIGTQRVTEIVRSLRVFSRSNESELKMVDIHEGIESTLMILQHRLCGIHGSKKIQLVQEYGQLPFIECFPGQINQVFMNILSNAIDILQEHEDNLGDKLEDFHPTISIHTETVGDDFIAVRIRDNGSGMDEEVSKKLFDPFFTTKAIGKGTGLGLSISYKIIVDTHRGYLGCNSTLGEGSEFIIKLPVIVDG
ncbi:MAG: ATP-binding protein [Cyanobacteria bacterium P01_A01_bin.45]